MTTEEIVALIKARGVDCLLKRLTYREREVIRLRYGLGDGYAYTLAQCGRIFKVTGECVRQIQTKAIRRLKKALTSDPDTAPETL
jgi:RNA polymerase primary sigma factor